MHRYAQAEGPDALDAILDQQRVPAAFDLITIDVDGIDYKVWQGLVRHRPRVVVIDLRLLDGALAVLPGELPAAAA